MMAAYPCIFDAIHHDPTSSRESWRVVLSIEVGSPHNLANKSRPNGKSTQRKMTKTPQIAMLRNYMLKCLVKRVIQNSMTYWTMNIKEVFLAIVVSNKIILCSSYSTCRNFIYSTPSYPIYTLREFQNMVQSMPKNFLPTKFGYVSLDRIWWERPSIRVHSIDFLQNYFGILWVVKVILDIYVIVLAIHLLLNRYSFLFLLLTKATSDTWLYCHTTFNWDSNRFGGWICGIGCGDRWFMKIMDGVMMPP